MDAGARVTRSPALGVAVVITMGALVGGLVEVFGHGFADLDVYRHGGRAVLEQFPVYAHKDPIHGYPFTYPPIAALLMAPLALVPAWVAAAAWIGASAGCLAATVLLACRTLGRPASVTFVIVAGAVALAFEPIWQNYRFGQINLILMLALLVDVVRPDRPTAGVLIGIAAGIKLTPLVFVVLLVLIGRRAAAVRAIATFVGTVLIGLVVLPGAPGYWGERLLEPTRVGPPSLVHNQSVTGALTRLLDGPPPTVLWLAIAGPLALGTVLIAAAWWHRGDRVLGAGLTALAMLIASPVSWSHHWVWAVPLALAVWEHSRVAAVLWAGVFVTRPILWPPWGDKREFAWHWYDHLDGNAYVLAALVLTGWLGWRLRIPVRPQ